MSWLLSLLSGLATIPKAINQVIDLGYAIAQEFKEKEARKRRNEKDLQVDNRINSIINPDNTDSL